MLDIHFKEIFFNDTALEEIAGELKEIRAREKVARNILKFLLYGECQNVQALFQMSTHVLKGMLVQKDANELYILRKETNKVFQHIHHKIKDRTLTESFRERLDLSLANLLSYYVMFEPTIFDDNLKIPRLIDNNYKLIEYKIEPIELTPSNAKVIKHPIQDHERVFSYGLTPVNNNQASRILVFCGTTFPVGQGLNTQLMMNLFPYTSLGEHYNWEKVTAWLSLKDDRIDVCGASQGGGLSLLLGLMHPEKIRRIDAMNPPGMLEDYDENCKTLGAWERAKKNNHCPEVFIQSHVGDPVPKVGFWKPDWKIFKLKVNANENWLTWFFQISILGFHPAFYTAHIVNFAGIPNSQIEKLTGEEDNNLLRQRRTQYVMRTGREILYKLIDSAQLFYHSLYLGNVREQEKDKDKENETPSLCKIHTEAYFQEIQSALNVMIESNKPFYTPSFLSYFSVDKAKQSKLKPQSVNVQPESHRENHYPTFWM